MTELVHLLIDHPLPGICRLTLNRSEKRNALNNTLRAEIFAQLKHNDRDPDLRLTVIRGAGPAFCSGYDLSADNTVGHPSSTLTARKWLIRLDRGSKAQTTKRAVRVRRASVSAVEGR